MSDPAPKDLQAALQVLADQYGGRVTACWYMREGDTRPAGSVTVYPTGTTPEDYPPPDGED